MRSGHLYMLLALACFSTLGVFHKLADVKNCRPRPLTALIYVWSLVLITAMVVLLQQRSPSAPAAVVSIGIPFGMSAAAAILAFQAGIRHGNIATSWLAINLSSGIPTVASIILYNESVSPAKAVALLLIPVAMLLLWKDKKQEEQRTRAGEPEAVAVRGKGTA
ncbi:MAG TPA: hypothetical protein VFL57_15120 [Bryobacteraceae bacterium]|nr:hypothetical protein [Bryobacteraceae bacterium]